MQYILARATKATTTAVTTDLVRSTISHLLDSTKASDKIIRSISQQTPMAVFKK
jgi:hypothetical protein